VTLLSPFFFKRRGCEALLGPQALEKGLFNLQAVGTAPLSRHGLQLVETSKALSADATECGLTSRGRSPLALKLGTIEEDLLTFLVKNGLYHKNRGNVRVTKGSKGTTKGAR
jgi:hypothetical protein